MAAAGHEVFLPFRRALRQWSDRRQWVEDPLFPGYLFARVEERGRLAVLQDDAVVRCLTSGGRIVEVGEGEIASLQALMAVPDKLDVLTQQAFPPGAAVYVSRGPLAGLHGRVLAHPRAHYLLVEVPSIRHAVRVHLPADWALRPVAGLSAAA